MRRLTAALGATHPGRPARPSPACPVGKPATEAEARRALKEFQQKPTQGRLKAWLSTLAGVGSVATYGLLRLLQVSVALLAAGYTIKCFDGLVKTGIQGYETVVQQPIIQARADANLVFQKVGTAAKTAVTYLDPRQTAKTFELALKGGKVNALCANYKRFLPYMHDKFKTNIKLDPALRDMSLWDKIYERAVLEAKHPQLFCVGKSPGGLKRAMDKAIKLPGQMRHMLRYLRP